MDGIVQTKKQPQPLCYGYVCENDLFFKIKLDFMQDFYLSGRIGANLVDFPWIDLMLADLIFGEIYKYYMALLFASAADDQIASELMSFADKYLHINIYFTMYLLGFIGLLLTGHLSGGLLSDSVLNNYVRRNGITFAKDGSIPLLEKKFLITVFLHSMEERQALVEQTLNRVLDETADTQSDALARFYHYESTDPLFRQHWHSRFEVLFGESVANPPTVVHLSVLERIDDMLRYELVQMLIRDVQYKRCQSCGKLFIPAGRSDSLYCDRAMLGRRKPCNQIGANLVAKKKVEENLALKLYRQAYQRLNKRVEFGYMTPDEFAQWKAQALPKREQCLRGELSPDEFTLWINETSRQRQGG